MRSNTLAVIRSASVKIIPASSPAQREKKRRDSLILVVENGGKAAETAFLDSRSLQQRALTLPERLTQRVVVDRTLFGQLTPEPLSPSLPFTSPHSTARWQDDFSSRSPSPNGELTSSKGPMVFPKRNHANRKAVHPGIARPFKLVHRTPTDQDFSSEDSINEAEDCTLLITQYSRRKSSLMSQTSKNEGEVQSEVKCKHLHTKQFV